MNARTANKLLRKRRGRYFWGQRSWFTVRVPPEVFPEPCPLIPWGITRVGRNYRVESEDLEVYFSDTFSGAAPNKQTALFLTKDGETYSWWEVFNVTDEGVSLSSARSKKPSTTFSKPC